MKRLFIVTWLGAAAAIGIAAPGAAAAGDLRAACHFSGHTSILDPIKYLGGTGRYRFNGKADCGGLDANKGAVLNGLTMVVDGSYSNTFCGNGTFYADPAAPGGVAGDEVALFQGDTKIVTAKLTVSVTAGTGTIDATKSTFAGKNNATDSLDSHAVELTDDTGPLAGDVQVKPGQNNVPQAPIANGGGPDLSKTCVTELDGTGDFSLVSN